jgi:hypothetical protein
MAGDWIKMRSNIKDDPDVVLIAGKLSTDEFSVIGRLHAVWAWLDQHSADGISVRTTSAYLDRLTACPGFAEALRAVGWLDGRDGSLTFPNFEKHNGETAKARALAKNRMQKQERNISYASSVRSVTQTASPEKRREEKSVGSAARPAGIEEAFEFSKAKSYPNKVTERWFKSRESTGWEKANGAPIRNWRADLDVWVMEEMRKNPSSFPKSEPKAEKRAVDPAAFAEWASQFATPPQLSTASERVIERFLRETGKGAA